MREIILPAFLNPVKNMIFVLGSKFKYSYYIAVFRFKIIV